MAQQKKMEEWKKAIDEAKETAEREKHEKRLRKLEEGGHQTSRYQEKFDGDYIIFHLLFWQRSQM